jgi:hypothetical protein
MKVWARCPQCKKLTEYGADAPDRRLRCAWCGTMVKIPPASELEDAARILRTDGGAVYIDENGKVYG